MQNQQLSDVKGKELVAAGHAFAKAIGMDTPLIEIAKMVSELASRLDCALVRGDELQEQRDALAAENGLAAKAVQTFCDVVGSNTDVIAEEMGMEGAKAILAAMSATGNMPATDAYLNSVRADAVQSLWDNSLSDVGQVLAEIRAYDDASEAAGIVHDEIKERVEEFSAQLRAGKDGE